MPPTELTAAQAEQWTIIQDTQACFGGEIGRRVLAQLEADFANRSSFMKTDRETAFAEGERHVVLVIKNRMAMRPQDLQTVELTAQTEEEIHG